MMFPQFTIRGAPRERGRQYGKHAADQIRISIASYARLFAYVRGIDWHTAQREARRYVPVIEQHAPDLLEEMRGIAEGAAVPFATIVALNVRTELLAGWRADVAHAGYQAAFARNRAADVPQPGECTTLAALPGATKNGAPLLAQTWDWYGEQRAACLLLRIEAPGAPTILTLTEAGILAKIGVNSAGVGVCLNILFTDRDGLEPGMPVHVQLRRVLQSGSAAEAIAQVENVQAAASSCITIVDRGGTGVSLEATPYGVGRLEPRNGLLAHTNHCVTEAVGAYNQPLSPASGSVPRFDRATALLHEHHGQIDHDTLIAALRDHTHAPTCICRHGAAAGADYVAESVTGVVLDVAAGTMLVAAGVPCQVPFERVAL